MLEAHAGGGAVVVEVAVSKLWEERKDCPSSYKVGRQSDLSTRGSGSFVCLIMRLVFDVASGVV